MIGCNPNNRVLGTYTSADKESIEFENDLASFSGGYMKLFPAMKYVVKNDDILIDSPETNGYIIFKIIDKNTIEGTNFLFKGDVFKKK